MKIETKFDVGQEIWCVYYGLKFSGGTMTPIGVKLNKARVRTIEIITMVGNDLSIVYNCNDSVGYEEHNCFPHTPEGKRQAEARIGELNK